MEPVNAAPHFVNVASAHGIHRILTHSGELCGICQTEELGQAPSLLLTGCGHVFHWDCLRQRVLLRWGAAPGAQRRRERLAFRELECPVCGADVDNPWEELRRLLAPYRRLRERVQQMALERLEFEGLRGRPEVAAAIDTLIAAERGVPEVRRRRAETRWAMDHFVFYACERCRAPFFGGSANCAADEAADDPAPERARLCGRCSASATAGDAPDCEAHGAQWVVHKCRFCCSLSSWFCFGQVHMCDPCHANWRELAGGEDFSRPLAEYPQCAGLRPQMDAILADPLLEPAEKQAQMQHCRSQPDSCPLGVAHPPNGIEFSLGCGLCRGEEPAGGGDLLE